MSSRPPPALPTQKPVELGKLIGVAYLVVILSAFAWAKEFLLPLILAILISFLLAPVVSRLERWRFPRPVAVLSVVAIGFALIGVLCSTLSLEGLDLVNSLPKYAIIFMRDGRPFSRGRLARSIWHLATLT